MNYRVIKDFIAKEDLHQYKAGDTFACLDAARAEILIERGYVARPESKPEPEPEKPQKAKGTFKKAAKTKKV